ncbi:MAG TPA: nitronate monooxygenase family protein [Candidatus Ruthenibacterium merdavium]|uniref:Probable nitronate monooxygenase n=1 Tax=Candidatus Ruthenibacterium merdavium TaxID=2838752 RepID=A0A9D2TLA9_9FIRM|nr:nitronate monooxygenase family protein [Candidatus Ruthenibacterium merdavium]
MSILLGTRTLDVPILQGGMGVGVSMGGLAGAVAECGAMGTISTAIPGYDEPDFGKNPNAANLRVLAREIEKAKRLSKEKGLVAINAMVATVQYAESVMTAIKSGVDAIVSGAGLPNELPAIAKGADVLLAPIVSGGRAARVICRMWETRHERYPDFVVLEGPQAGGHLGFSKEEAKSDSAPKLEDLIKETVEALRPFEERAKRAIPVFAAGGVWDGKDAACMARQGAAGVQMATRFIGTYECDASQGFKDILLAAKKEDIQIVQSPVGMPGRALRTPLIERLSGGVKTAAEHCVNCLTPCPKKETPYCIMEALVKALKGNYEEGLFFCGSNVWRMDKMMHVSELIDEIMRDWRAFA